MTVELSHDKSPQKYGTGPVLNSQPLDLQSDMLPTALQGPVWTSLLLDFLTIYLFIYI